MFYLNNLNRTRETMENASVGFPESDFSQFCIYKVDVTEVDYENKTITVDHDGDEISGVAFIGHTDIDYSAYLENDLELPGSDSDYFDNAVFMLLREESVLFFKHSTDSTKNFATQWVDQETGKDQFSNCPGTTYWGYAIFEFKVYDSGTYDERYYLIWDCDNDEPAKIVDDSGDLLTESDWPVHEDDLDDWLTDYRISTIYPNSVAPTYSDREFQLRATDSLSPNYTECPYCTGTDSWSISGSNYTGLCADYNTTHYTYTAGVSTTWDESIQNGASYAVVLGYGNVTGLFDYAIVGGVGGGKGNLTVPLIGLSFNFNHQLSTSYYAGYAAGSSASGTFKAIFGKRELTWSASKSQNASSTIYSEDNWEGYTFIADNIKYMHTQTLRKNGLVNITHYNTNITQTESTSLVETEHVYFTAVTTDMTGEIPSTNGDLSELLQSVSDTLVADNSSYDVVLYDKTLRYAKYDSRIPLLEAA